MNFNIYFAFLLQFLMLGNTFAQYPSEILSEQTFPNDMTKNDMKILVLVIASDQYPVWQNDQKAWQAYMHLDPEHVEAYFIKFDPNLASEYDIQGDVIWIKGTENFIPGILSKTLTSMEVMLPRIREFNYIIRTNLSSFWVFPRLFKFLESLPKEKCYCGSYAPDWCFVSGAGIMFSPDMIEFLVQNKQELLNYQVLDDVAIGTFLTKHHVKKINADRTDFIDIHAWFAGKDKISSDAFHFRTKMHAHYLDQYFIEGELCKMFYGVEIK